VWSEQPSLAEADRALLVVQQHRIRIGRPVVLLCILAPSVKMPDDKVRERMRVQWPQLIEQASTLQFVNLAASGFTSSRLFSLIVAGFMCMFFPFGTALGVFTFIVLTRESVRRLYFETESQP
jgi:hypothetical protein